MKTTYRHIWYYWNDADEDMPDIATISVGTPPESGTIEDMQTMYHFTDKEWDTIEKRIRSGKKISPRGCDFTITDIDGPA
jgi:hypothetical protein